MNTITRFQLFLLALLLYVVYVKAALVPIWGQCGGLTYKGPTECEPGLVCKKKTDYLWQCVPEKRWP
ncbi:hypothetical protein CPB86DRAFT_876410 [Serendipita vermifera]|nr:hypothetical protein CPB86DRAFT_876410 [Serendipita vermifera]